MHTGFDLSEEANGMKAMYDLTDKGGNQVSYGDYEANEVIVPGDKYRYCMVARYHEGDENGSSQAKFGDLKLSDEARAAGFSEVWLSFTRAVAAKESASKIVCNTSPAEVITRRMHGADENGTTCYELMKVVVSKKLPDGNVTVNCRVIADDPQPVTSQRESSAGWVECPGKVMVGREHYGDQNAQTITRFANIYVVDNDGKKYKLNLSGIKITLIQPEKYADFYVDTGVYYGIDGVCHQMANRFLLPCTYIIHNLDGRPRGYGLSCGMFGEHGSTFNNWQKGTYMPVFLNYHPAENVSAESVETGLTTDFQTHNEEKETDLLTGSACAFLQKNGVNVSENPIAAEQKAWMKRRTEIMRKYGFLSDEGKRQKPVGLTCEHIRSMVDEINEEARILQTALREKIGVESYIKINGADRIFEVVNYETACNLYIETGAGCNIPTTGKEENNNNKINAN